MPFRRSSLLIGACALVFSALIVGCTGGGAGTGQFLTSEESRRMEAQTIIDVQNKIAKEQKIDPWEVKADDIAKDEAVKKIGVEGEDGVAIVNQWLDGDVDSMAWPAPLTGYKKLDFNSTNNPVLGYAAVKPSDPANPMAKREYADFKTVFGSDPVEVMELKLTITPPPPPVEKGKPQPPAPKPTIRTVFFGPIGKKAGTDFIANATKTNPTMKIETIKTYPVEFWSNDQGRVISVVSGQFKYPHRVIGAQNMFYWKVDPKKLKEIETFNESAKEGVERKRMPRQINIPVVAAR